MKTLFLAALLALSALPAFAAPQVMYYPPAPVIPGKSYNVYDQMAGYKWSKAHAVPLSTIHTPCCGQVPGARILYRAPAVHYRPTGAYVLDPGDYHTDRWTQRHQVLERQAIHDRAARNGANGFAILLALAVGAGLLRLVRYLRDRADDGSGPIEGLR